MRKYKVEYSDSSVRESQEFTAKDNESAIAKAKQLTLEWIQAGDWGYKGASIPTDYRVYDARGNEIANTCITVNIEPDHEYLIQEAVGHNMGSICGPSPEDHDWTSEGEGGCRENPGVWSHGGTKMSSAEHCRKCGLHRSETNLGSQRNPGEHDTVTYEMLSDEAIKHHRENGTME